MDRRKQHVAHRTGLGLKLVLMIAVAFPWQAVVSAGQPSGDAKSSKPGAETRDVLLMLASGPLHLRFNVTLAGTTLSAAREQYIDDLIDQLDANGDGKLTKAEADASPLRQKLKGQSRVSASFLEKLKAKQTVSRREIEKMVERSGGETIRYRQDDSSSESDSQVFRVLDANGDDVLDSEEMLSAAEILREMDEDRDQCISFRELSPTPEPEPMVGIVQIATPEVEESSSTFSSAMRDMREPLLGGRVLRMYDRNRDGNVTAEELHWPSDRIAMLDSDNNGMLDRSELGSLKKTPVALELSIELDPEEGQEVSIQIDQCSGQRIDDGLRGDMIKIDFGGSVVTFSHRDVDPIDSSIANAMQEFNRMDGDGNGYLEKTETSQRIRFQRYLFDQIDEDSDGKIFGEEMEKYIRVAAAPRATTCQVNVYDTGRGFFTTLDSNGDGRISERELRKADDSLASMSRDQNPSLGLDEPTTHFQVEFVRRMYNLFGSTDQMIVPTVAIAERKTTVGPDWFRAWDRNNDGDLTWEEFAGPREIFHRFDADNDQLLDHREAGNAHRSEG